MLLPSIGLFCCVALTVVFSVVIVAHHQNIVRIFTGKENSIGIRRALRGKGEHHLKELEERKARKVAAEQNNDSDNTKSD